MHKRKHQRKNDILSRSTAWFYLKHSSCSSSPWVAKISNAHLWMCVSTGNALWL